MRVTSRRRARLGARGQRERHVQRGRRRCHLDRGERTDALRGRL